MIKISLSHIFNIFLGFFLLCTPANASPNEHQDDWRDTFRRTVTEETRGRMGISTTNPNDDNDNDNNVITPRRGSLMANAAHAAASAYNHRLKEPTTGGKARTDDEPMLIPKKPLFLSALSDRESHLKRLESANSCLSVTEIIGSRVLSNIFLGLSVSGVILAGGLSQFYDPKVGEIVLYIAGSCSTIGTLLKQVTDTKMKVMSDMRERNFEAMATQAAAEIGDLQAGHQRTKEKLRIEKEKKIAELKALREAFADLQGRTTGTHSPIAGLLFQHTPAARGATPDIPLREKSKRPPKEALPSDSDSQKLDAKLKPKRTKKKSKLTTTANSSTTSPSSSDESSDADADAAVGTRKTRVGADASDSV